MISAALVRACATLLAANWSKSNFCLDMFRSRRLRNISDASSESETQSTIASASNPHLEIEQFAAQGRIPHFTSMWKRIFRVIICGFTALQSWVGRRGKENL